MESKVSIFIRYNQCPLHSKDRNTQFKGVEAMWNVWNSCVLYVFD